MSTVLTISYPFSSPLKRDLHLAFPPDALLRAALQVRNAEHALLQSVRRFTAILFLAGDGEDDGVRWWAMGETSDRQVGKRQIVVVGAGDGGCEGRVGVLELRRAYQVNSLRPGFSTRARA